jgi:hypothetical protein
MKNDLPYLHAKYPWPAARPYASEEIVCFDGGGRELICREIARRSGCVVLEIGSFLGDSARRWLAASQNSVVVCVDPWDDWWIKRDLNRNRTELFRRLAEPDGPINCFFTNMWPYRDRVVAVRGYAPAAIIALHADGVVPDIVYFDSDKSGPGIVEAIQLFPNALITGDDWSWSEVPHHYPIRAPVRRAARQTGRRLVVRRATWLLQPKRLSARQYLDKALSRVADLVRPLRSRLRKL